MNTFYTLLNNNPGLTLACGSNGKENSCNAGDLPGFNPSVRKIPWRREWLPTSAFSPGEFHGQRSLADYSPWGHKELDTTEWLSLSGQFRQYPSGNPHQMGLSALAQEWMLLADTAVLDCNTHHPGGFPEKCVRDKFCIQRCRTVILLP